MQPLTANRSEPLLIAVGGGKGGVGKTVVAANLALALAKLGARVTAIDAAFEQTRMHPLFGLHDQGPSLEALLDGRVASLEDLVIQSGQVRLDLIRGTSTPPDSEQSYERLVHQLCRLDADVVVIECGAGTQLDALDFVSAADAYLVVGGVQLPSLQNAYSFVKHAVRRSLRRCAAAAKKLELFEAASDAPDSERAHQVLERIAAEDPELARELLHALASERVALLGNQLGEGREINAIHALARMLNDFLGVHASVAGALRKSDRIQHSVARRRPFLTEAGSDPESQQLLRIAEGYLSLDVRALRERRAARVFGTVHSSAQTLLEATSVSTLRGLPAPLSRYQRAHERLGVDWPVTVETGSGRWHGSVRDISRTGAKLRLTSPLLPESRVCVCFDAAHGSLRLDARIVHSAAGIVGVVFEPRPADAVIAPLLELGIASARKTFTAGG